MVLQFTSAPAQGKTYGAKTLNPNETYIINVDGKGLSWAGWRADYNAEKKNYVEEKNIDKVKAIIKGVTEHRPDIKIIIVDTLTILLEEMLNTDKSRNALDKWKNYGEDAYSLYTFCTGLKRPGTEDFFIVFMAHAETYKTVDAMGFECLAERTKFAGSVSAKNTLTKFLSYNLGPYIDMSAEDDENRYMLATQSNGKNELRSVGGVLPKVMKNDMGEVIRLIRKHDLMLPE